MLGGWFRGRKGASDWAPLRVGEWVARASAPRGRRGRITNVAGATVTVFWIPADRGGQSKVTDHEPPDLVRVSAPPPH